ncbi:MAG: hypothetical protein OEV43_04455 [Coriobacteriia bacterium]|nr:hypothetical protein [Coriobacteriia bacterium]
MSAEEKAPMEESEAAKTTVRNSVASSVVAEHDAEVTGSLAGVVNAQGDATVSQTGSLAIMARGDVEATQTGAGAIVSRSMSGEGIYSCIAAAGDMSVRRGWIGVAISPKMEVSEDSRVFIGPRAAFIIAAAILGIFGIVAAFGVIAARKAMGWRPKVPSVSWHRMGE